jgi:hypothetical protein
MKRNFFQEPKPKGISEITEALEEYEMEGSYCSAIIDYNQDDGDFKGYSAEIYDDSDNMIFLTLGYDNEEDLRSDLFSCGIDKISHY